MVLSRYFQAHGLAGLPVGVISGWNDGLGDDLNKNVCMHYPDFAHPGRVLELLKAVANRDAQMLKVRDNILVRVASVHDGTTDFVSMRT